MSRLLLIVNYISRNHQSQILAWTKLTCSLHYFDQLSWSFPRGRYKKHQTFQVPNGGILTYISCMDTAYVREIPPPPPKYPYVSGSGSLQIRYRNPLVKKGPHCRAKDRGRWQCWDETPRYRKDRLRSLPLRCCGWYLSAAAAVEPRKKPSYFPLYWLFNRDPYKGLLQSLYNRVV